MTEILGPGSVDPTLREIPTGVIKHLVRVKSKVISCLIRAEPTNRGISFSGNYLSNDGIVKPARFDRYLCASTWTTIEKLVEICD